MEKLTPLEISAKIFALDIAKEQIKELEAALAVEKEKHRWRKWPEEKPNDTTEVLCLLSEKIFETAVFVDDVFLRDDGDYGSYQVQATHWRPIYGPEE
jgi:hypothetical protein